MRKFQTEVMHGAQVLDAWFADNAHDGGKDLNWRNSINLRTLDLTQVEDCVLGQVFGDYYEGLYKLGIEDRRMTRYELGFSMYPDTETDFWTTDWDEELRKEAANWEELQNEWVLEIQSGS